MFKTVVLLNIFVETVYATFIEQHLFETEIFIIVFNVFTVTFDQFD